MELMKWLKNKKELAEPLAKIPVHVAIVMDGNGRWAEKRGLPRTMGHRAALERIRDVVSTCAEVGVKYLTLYAFSTENWKRPTEEVNFLMNLFQETLKVEVTKLHQQGVRIRFIGLKRDLSPVLLEMMEGSEKITAGNTVLTLNIAINYGGRGELAAAAKGLVRSAIQNNLDPESIDEESIAAHLFTAGQPDPDLLIRPGGEYRISNFLIWQLAYAEFYFSDTLWPDFGREKLLEAFRHFGKRERRFGGVKGGNTAT
jgi:undecaprenyl diphosphate synthase